MTTTASPTASRASTPTVIVTFDELKRPEGNLKARRAVDARKQVVIRIDGVKAFIGASGIERSAPGATSTVVSGGVAEVALTIAIVAGVVAVVGLSVVAVVCLYGMEKGYSVTSRHRTGATGSVFDDELEIILVPPAGS